MSFYYHYIPLYQSILIANIEQHMLIFYHFLYQDNFQQELSFDDHINIYEKYGSGLWYFNETVKITYYVYE